MEKLIIFLLILFSGNFTFSQINASFTISDATVCMGETITFTSTSTSTAGFATWTWNFGGGTPSSGSTQGPHTITFSSPGNYNITLEVTDTNGVSDDITLPVTIYNVPTIGASNNGPLCESGNLSLSAYGGTSYLWTGPNGFTSTANPATVNNINTGHFGTYTVLVTDANGCQNTTTTTLTTGTSPTVTVNGTNVLCNGESSGYASTTVTGGTPGYTYLWSPSNNTNAIANGLAAGNHSVVVTDASGCKVTGNVVISEPALLGVTIATTTSYCTSNTGTATATVTGGTGPFTYFWSPVGGSTNVASNLSPGTYQVTVTDDNHCQVIETAQIVLAPFPVIKLDNSTNISCFGFNNGSAQVSTAGGTPGYTYSWSPSGGTSSSASNLSPGTYTITVTDIAGCTDIETVTLTEPSDIIVTHTSQDSRCGYTDGEIEVNASGGVGAFTYTWSPNVSTTNQATNLGKDLYNVIITDATGCSKNLSVNIDLFGTLPISVYASVPLLIEGETGQLTAVVPSDLVYDSVIWIPNSEVSCNNCLDPLTSPMQTTTYYATVYSSDGCMGVDSVTIRVKPPCTDLYVPTAFSPNDDGLNDTQCILGTCIESMEYIIFDRWGEIVFQSDNQKNCWDGMLRGSPAQTGVYVYKLAVTFENGEKVVEKGQLELIR